MILLFLGASGSGKDTQARNLVKDYGFLNIGSGEMLRLFIKKNNSLGRLVKKYVNCGNLVPDKMFWEVVSAYIKKSSKRSNVVYQGFVRKVSQIEILDTILRKEGRTIDKVVYFDLSVGEAIKRLSKRRICPRCNEIYDLEDKKPEKPGICDNDGVRLIQREDDKPDAIRRRMKFYTSNIEQILAIYKERGILVKVDASRNIFEVYDELKNKIGYND